MKYRVGELYYTSDFRGRPAVAEYRGLDAARQPVFRFVKRSTAVDIALTYDECIRCAWGEWYNVAPIMTLALDACMN